MLGSYSVGAVVPVSDAAKARAFYEGALGLKVTEESSNGDVRYQSGDTALYAYVTPHAGKAAHTIAGWEVADLDAEMKELRSAGITFEDYDLPGLKTVNGVVEMENMRGAWFKDPDGNILSLMQRA